MGPVDTTPGPDPVDADPDGGTYDDPGPEEPIGFQRWMKRSASGAILSGIALGLQQALEPEARAAGIRHGGTGRARGPRHGHHAPLRPRRPDQDGRRHPRTRQGHPAGPSTGRPPGGRSLNGRTPSRRPGPTPHRPEGDHRLHPAEPEELPQQRSVEPPLAQGRAGDPPGDGGRQDEAESDAGGLEDGEHDQSRSGEHGDDLTGLGEHAVRSVRSGADGRCDPIRTASSWARRPGGGAPTSRRG